MTVLGDPGLDQVIRLSPLSPTAFFNRGLAYAEKAMTDRAI